MTAYSFFGCDYNAGFAGITHGHGLNTFHELSKENILKTRDDFLKLILTAYANKYRTMQLLFSTEEELTEDEKIMHFRGLLKAMKGNEKNSIPLPSVLKLQFNRSKYISQFWLGKLTEADHPEENGWSILDSKLELKMQDLRDKYYCLPNELLKGCGCKSTVCTKRCQCVKREQKCSRLTCKSCKCFKRQKENEDDDVVLSSRFQDFIDQMGSSEDESEIENEESDDESGDESGDESDLESEVESELSGFDLQGCNSEDEFGLSF